MLSSAILSLRLLLLSCPYHHEIDPVHLYDLVLPSWYASHLPSLGAAHALYRDLVVLVYETYRAVARDVGADRGPVLDQLAPDPFYLARVRLLLPCRYLLQHQCV